MSPAQLRHLADMRKAKWMRIIASINPDEGWWSWKSSPHVLWLAGRLA